MKIKVYRHRSPPSLTHSLLKAEPQTHKHACTEAGLTAWPSRCCQEIWNSITASPHSFSDADGGEQTLKMYKGLNLTCVALPRIQIKHNTHKKKFLVELKQQNRDKKKTSGIIAIDSRAKCKPGDCRTENQDRKVNTEMTVLTHCCLFALPAVRGPMLSLSHTRAHTQSPVHL